ncbi:putative MFS-type transporter YcaD [Aliiroseovarius pelagivivens]|uniref:Putative MFS-type transporter YcaD n=1 Tax=Aliiroseovarius pelagivivens TaxID=1639690 RepID=A0A2R8AHV1_9RHOB|nr:MFS transporter [Aliiroseovarius pelagivivens]SPF75600.1 putative MFS-type transporter YcaD [Aliiroseovarius pelagivivens]
MRLFLSFTPLLLSIVLLQLSSGGAAPLDAVSGLTLGFTRAEVGLLGSAHFVGFFVGCWWAPRLMGAVGHARAYAGFAALGAIGLLAHMMWIDPYAWAIMRMATGLCVAGSYTVIESWLNARVTNDTRGRVMGGYRIVELGGSLCAQLMIAVLEPAHYISYNILAIACCAAILPLALTRARQPKMPEAPRLRPALAWMRSPLAVAAVITSGITTSAFRMVGPIYGNEVGLETSQLAWFLAAFVLGGALAQLPAGWLADRYDRRWVLIWLSAAAIASCMITVLAAGSGITGVFLTAGLFGFTTFPIFSVAAAHANDFASSEERVELSAALMFYYAVGAIASPLLASNLIESYGPSALFTMIAVGHVVLIGFGLARMRHRPTLDERTPYTYTPRTTFSMGRLFGKLRDRG